MLYDSPDMIDPITYVIFCSLQSLCLNHSMKPFVAIYVPDFHGNKPLSLMVLFDGISLSV